MEGVCKTTVCGKHALCELFPLCGSNVSVCGNACVRTVCVTHLLCVGGLDALCCKGCGSVGLCGEGVVCELGMVLDGVLVAGNYCGDGVVVWGWFLGTTGIFPKFLGNETNYFKPLFYQGFPLTSHSSSLHLFTRSSATIFPHLTAVKYLSSERRPVKYLSSERQPVLPDVATE